MSEQRRLRPWMLVVVSVLVVFVVVAIGTPGAVNTFVNIFAPATPPWTDPDHPPECPVDKVTVRDTATGSLVGVAQLALPAANTLVPEYHDCQRFPLATGKYGPLVGIFARNGLNVNIKRIQDLAGVSASNRAVAVASILSWDDGYKPLGIRIGYNCLYVWSDGTWAADGKPTKTAAMVPVSTDSACIQDLDPDHLPSGNTKLWVLRHDLSVPVTTGGAVTHYGEADYPEVARWDWDPQVHIQFIGIGCGGMWCDIGPASLHYLPAHDDPASQAKPDVRRVFQIKGWHDEQLLAVYNSTSKVALPTAIVGTILPTPNLYTDSLDKYKTWNPAAMTFLSAASPDYVTKLNFQKGDEQGKQFNLIELCNGSAAVGPCYIPPGDMPQPCANTADPWYARVTSAPPVKVAYLCVIRRTHAGVIVPKIVRWRWDSKDEHVWIGCGDGCCEGLGKIV